MSASTSAPKTTITQSIDGCAGGVPTSRPARASCETRRNDSLTGSGDPPAFSMPQIIAPTPTVRNTWLRWLGRPQHGAERAQWSDVATGGGLQAEGLQPARGLGLSLPPPRCPEPRHKPPRLPLHLGLAQVLGGFPTRSSCSCASAKACMAVQHEALSGLQFVHPLAQRIGPVGFGAYGVLRGNNARYVMMR
jgi:hypothetical protein